MLLFQYSFLNRASYFLRAFWKMLSTIKMSQRWLTFYKTRNFRTHYPGRLASPACNFRTDSRHVSDYVTAWVSRQGRAFLRPGFRASFHWNMEPERTLEHSLQGEIWECLCPRAQESPKTKPRLGRLPAPGWRTGSFLECR